MPYPQEWTKTPVRVVHVLVSLEFPAVLEISAMPGWNHWVLDLVNVNALALPTKYACRPRLEFYAG